MTDEHEVIDYQARQDIAVIQSGLADIKSILNHILTALVVGMAGAAGASAWNVLFHTGH